MKLIKISVFAVSILVSSFSFSQENNNHKSKTEIDKLAKELNLNEEQKRIFIELNIGFEHLNQDIESNSNLVQEEKKEQIENNNAKLKVKILEILSEEQKDKYNKIEYSKNH